jgi:hypothetical protein
MPTINTTFTADEIALAASYGVSLSSRMSFAALRTTVFNSLTENASSILAVVEDMEYAGVATEAEMSALEAAAADLMILRRAVNRNVCAAQAAPHKFVVV